MQGFRILGRGHHQLGQQLQPANRQCRNRCPRRGNIPRRHVCACVAVLAGEPGALLPTACHLAAVAPAQCRPTDPRCTARAGGQSVSVPPAPCSGRLHELDATARLECPCHPQDPASGQLTNIGPGSQEAQRIWRYDSAANSWTEVFSNAFTTVRMQASPRVIGIAATSPTAAWAVWRGEGSPAEHGSSDRPGSTLGPIGPTCAGGSNPALAIAGGWAGWAGQPLACLPCTVHASPPGTCRPQPTQHSICLPLPVQARCGPLVSLASRLPLPRRLLMGASPSGTAAAGRPFGRASLTSVWCRSAWSAWAPTSCG